MNDDDGAYDAYLSDWYDDRDRILTTFGEFWVAYTRLLQASGVVITSYLEIMNDRRAVFYDEFLDNMSLTRAARVVKRIFDDL